MSFANRIVYITGASAGLGEELARQLAARGARLALFARRTDRLEALARDLAARHPAATPFVAACDVTDRAAVRAAFDRAAAALGPCDVLVANAGIGYPVPARGFDAGKARGIYDVNLYGALHAIEAVLPAMLARRAGQIVGISSLASYRSFPESHVYCASKSALSAQLEGLRMELAPQGIAVTTICPGFIKTDMTARNNFKMPFLMECDAAVTRIVDAIERKARVYSFPRRLYWIIKATRLIPEALFAKLATPPTGKSYKRVDG